MAVVAYEIVERAVRAVGTAEELVTRMEPHLKKRYGDSAIYAYTNGRAVPPGDVLLAAAVAAGISLDERLGIGRQPTGVERQVEELRAEMAELREEVATLRRDDGQQPEPEHGPAAEAAAAQRRRRDEWARRSSASPQAPPASTSTGRRAGRGHGV